MRSETIHRACQSVSKIPGNPCAFSLTKVELSVAWISPSCRGHRIPSTTHECNIGVQFRIRPGPGGNRRLKHLESVMAKQQPEDQSLRAHPLLSKLLEVGANVRAFRGYIGPSKDPERVRLYPSLGDLGFSIEINSSDIVATADAPEALLPHSGTVIWVKPEAEVVCHGDRVNIVSARRAHQAAVGTEAGRLVEVQTGRVNIKLRKRVMSTCASCTCSSCETHPGCSSTCNQVTSMREIVGRE